MNGCYVAHDVEPSQQPRLSPRLDTRLLGVATLPDGEQVACGTFIVPEDDGPDWIGLYLPVGALASVYDAEDLTWYPPTRHEGDYTVDR